MAGSAMNQSVFGSLAALLAVAGPLFAQAGSSSLFHLRPNAGSGAADQAPVKLTGPGQAGEPSLAPAPSAPSVQQLPEPPPQPLERPTTLAAPTPLEAPPPATEAAPALVENLCPMPAWVGGRSWVTAESLIWWTSRASLAIPLVTTGTATSQPLGTVGASTTTILFGDSDLHYDDYLGARVTAGYWLNPAATLGIDVGGFIAKSHGVRFLDTSTLAAIPPPLPLARPIVDPATGANSAITIISPGTSTGSIQVRSDSRLWGTEANLAVNVVTNDRIRADLIGGARYLDLTENLGIVQDIQGSAGGNVTFIGLPVAAGTTVEGADRFYARDQFVGGQVGTRVQVLCCDCLIVSLVTMMALGPTHEVVDVAGNTKLLGSTLTVPGGLLALPTNIGRQTHDEFAFIPQLGLTLAYRAGQHCRFSLGYDFLYWSRVVRPGDQINAVVNVTQAPSSASFGPLTGPAQPAPFFRQTDFWAQGLHLGLEVSY